jgi:hypothetical protein
VFTVDEVGSIGNLYELVKSASQRHPVAGNHAATYLTMTSKGVRYLTRRNYRSSDDIRAFSSAFCTFVPISAWSL